MSESPNIHEQMQAAATVIDEAAETLIAALDDYYALADQHNPVVAVSPNAEPASLFPPMPRAGIYRGELQRIAAEAVLRKLVDAGLAERTRGAYFTHLESLMSTPNVRTAIDKVIARIETFGGTPS